MSAHGHRSVCSITSSHRFPAIFVRCDDHHHALFADPLSRCAATILGGEPWDALECSCGVRSLGRVITVVSCGSVQSPDPNHSFKSSWIFCTRPFRGTGGVTASSNERAPEPAYVPPITPAVGRVVSPRRHQSSPRLTCFMPREGRHPEQQRRLVSSRYQERRARPNAGARRAERGFRRPWFIAVFSAERTTHAQRPRCLRTGWARAKRAPDATPATAKRLRQPPSPPPHNALLSKYENTKPLAKPFTTAAAATDRPHHRKKGLGARERWPCRSPPFSHVDVATHAAT